MRDYILNTLAILITVLLAREIPCLQNNRGELDIGKLTGRKDDITLAVGSTVYTARGFYKSAGRTLSEKLLRNMEKELDNESAICYTVDKSQKGLDCKRERSIA
jgi:hypothetical protein